MVMRMRSQSFQRKMAPFPFTKLPAELRNRIYACCLLVEGYVMPYPEYSACPQPLDHGAAKLRVWPTITYHQEKLRLFIGVLSVSRAVHQEAAPIFYGKNTFRITPLAKDLSYSFTLRDGNGKVTMTSTSKKRSTNMMLSSSSSKVMTMTPRTRFGHAKAVLYDT